MVGSTSIVAFLVVQRLERYGKYDDLSLLIRFCAMVDLRHACDLHQRPVLEPQEGGWPGVRI